MVYSNLKEFFVCNEMIIHNNFLFLSISMTILFFVHSFILSHPAYNEIKVAGLC